MHKIPEIQKTSVFSRRNLLWSAGIIIIGAIVLVCIGLHNHSNWGERGTYGDFIGGTAGIFLEMLTIIAILYAQIENNENNREILAVSNRQGDLQFLSFYLQEIKSLSEKAFPEFKTQGEDPLSELEWIYYSLLDPPGYNPNKDRILNLFGESGALGKTFAKNGPKRMSVKSLLTGLGDLISWDRNSERKKFQGLYHSNYGSTIDSVVPQESIFILIFLWYLSIPKLNDKEANNIWLHFQTRYEGEDKCLDIDVTTSINILKRDPSEKKSNQTSQNELISLFAKTQNPLHSPKILAIFREDPLDKLSSIIHTDFLEHTLQGEIYECALTFSQSILQLLILSSRIGFYKSIQRYCFHTDQIFQNGHLQCFFGGVWIRLSRLVNFDEKLALSESKESVPERILFSSLAPLLRESLIPIRTGILKILDSAKTLPLHDPTKWTGNQDKSKKDLDDEIASVNASKQPYIERLTPYVHTTALILSDLISSIDATDYEFFHSTEDHFSSESQPILNTEPTDMDKKSSKIYQNYLKDSFFVTIPEEITNEITPLLKKLHTRHDFLKENLLYPYNSCNTR